MALDDISASDHSSSLEPSWAHQWLPQTSPPATCYIMSKQSPTITRQMCSGIDMQIHAGSRPSYPNSHPDLRVKERRRPAMDYTSNDSVCLSMVLKKNKLELSTPNKWAKSRMQINAVSTQYSWNCDSFLFGHMPYRYRRMHLLQDIREVRSWHVLKFYKCINTCWPTMHLCCCSWMAPTKDNASIFSLNLTAGCHNRGHVGSKILLQQNPSGAS